MKITIRNEPEESVMELWLKPSYSNEGVILMGKDKNGDEWNMLRITEVGVYLCDGIECLPDWPLDAAGRLKLVSE